MNFRLFTDHPASVGETYWQHFGFAARFGGSMVAGGLACMVHGVLPFLCTTSGSRRVRRLYDMLQGHPSRRAIPVEDTILNWSI